MSHHKTGRELHGEHEDARNEAAVRTRALIAHEQAVRTRALERLVGVLVQRPEPHIFHECPVRPISARRAWGWPDAPGTTDSTGFLEGGIV